MHNNFKEYVARFGDLTDKDFEQMAPYISVRTVQKNKFVFESGNVCQEMGYLISGALRIYYVDKEDQQEVTRDIVIPNNFFSALTSYITGNPSYESIQAVVNSKMLVIKKEHLDKLYSINPKWMRLGLRIMEGMYVEQQERVYRLINFSAEERYRHLLHRSPHILHTVPLQYIASFLGITSQSLSRIRKKMYA